MAGVKTRKPKLAGAAKAPFPSGIAPMLAMLVAKTPPDEANWTTEFKWDGVRAIAYWDGAKLDIRSRNDLPIVHRYPELQLLTRQLGKRSAVLDGEIIAIDEKGRPSFPLLQRRMLIEGEKKITRLSGTIPISYVIFDLLYLDGKSTTELSCVQRREILDGLGLRSEHWSVSPRSDEMQMMLETAREQRLEGLVLKRKDSLYEVGRRARSWLKYKIVMRQEFVIAGWVPEGLTNLKRVGAIMVGYYDKASKELIYAGAVGTGFDAKWHELLARRFAALEVKENPFAGRPRKEGARFLRPEMVAEIEYRRWPAHTGIQQAAFKGLREDKAARQVFDDRVDT